MTFSLAQTPPTNMTFAGYVSATTAVNLLVCAVSDFGQTTQPTYTFPAGWIHIPACDAISTTPFGNTQIWYYPNNPGGITTVTVTGGSNPPDTLFYEFAGAGSGGGGLDATGIKTSTSMVTTLAVATSGTTAAAHDVAVSVTNVNYASATKTTISAGTGFTLQGSTGQGLKQTNHDASDFELDTGASSGITVTDTVAFSTAAGPVAASIAVFKATTAAAVLPPRPVVMTQAIKCSGSF